jgi:SAM-dependent methyltransferase
MSNETRQNWFNQGGEAYARFRPDYPDTLASFLASVSPSTRLAVDVGCGTGQLTTQLAEHFDAVIGLDPSAGQIASAQQHERVRYLSAPAEALPADDHSVSLITAAQAAHWFDLPAFYAEARRIGEPGAVVALISYGVPVLDAAIQSCYQTFYSEQIGPYWPPERALVDSGYATIDFPFQALPKPELFIERHWDLADMLGYISTWSAVKRAKDAGQQALLEDFARDLGAAWGSPEARRHFRWPINLRLGTL